jgi:hypothetical protein
MDTKYEVYGLYCLCHPEDGVRYVGQTTRGLRARLSLHRAHAKRGVKSQDASWIRKHDLQIEIILLEKCSSVESMNEREVHWIAWFRSIKDDMTNQLEGGGTGFRGMKRPDVSERMKGAGNPMYGKDRKELMIYARSFQTTFSEVTRERMSRAQTGRRHPPETREKMSASQIASWSPERHASASLKHSGSGNAMSKITEEDVRTIRRTREETGLSYAKIGKQYGLGSEAVSMICRRHTWKHVL